MSMLPTSTQLSTLSSVPTQIQHLNNSDLRVLPATPEQIQDWERREAKRELETYFTYSYGKIKSMNQVTHHHKKCVMTLQSSGSSIGNTGLLRQSFYSIEIRSPGKGIIQKKGFHKGCGI
jgi:hypothetical protein